MSSMVCRVSSVECRVSSVESRVSSVEHYFYRLPTVNFDKAKTIKISLGFMQKRQGRKLTKYFFLDDQ